MRARGLFQLFARNLSFGERRFATSVMQSTTDGEFVITHPKITGFEELLNAMRGKPFTHKALLATTHEKLIPYSRDGIHRFREVMNVDQIIIPGTNAPSAVPENIQSAGELTGIKVGDFYKKVNNIYSMRLFKILEAERLARMPTYTEEQLATLELQNKAEDARSRGMFSRY